VRNHLKIALATVFFVLSSASAQATSSSGLLMAIAKILSREMSEEAAEQLVTRYGKELGGELLERVQTRLLNEGGEVLVRESAELAVKYGPDVLRALDNTGNPSLVLQWIKEVPGNEVASIASRLSAGSVGRELADIGAQAGVSVVRAEAKHPGVGIAYARKLPKEWAQATLELSTDQAIVLGKHIDDIAVLPATQQKQLLELCKSHPVRFLEFVKDFVKNNPAKVLFTAGATTILIANARQLFGDERLGKDQYHGGFFGYLAMLGHNMLIGPWLWTLYGIGTVIIGYLALLSGLKLLFFYNARTRMKKDQFEQTVKPPHTNPTFEPLSSRPHIP
jgi:hypothetical protein